MTDAFAPAVTDALPVTGGCLCGAVRWSATAAPLAVRSCWCGYCQRLAAGSATVNMVFAADAVTITGTLSAHEAVADSGNAMRREFCPACGTPVTSRSAGRPHQIVMRAGTLDHLGSRPPEMVIWTEAAPDWAPRDPTLPASLRQPPPAG